MNLNQFLKKLKQTPDFSENVTTWKVIPATEGKFAHFPDNMSPLLQKMLINRGISMLYTHQADAFNASMRGENVCVVTPTASGKTHCYNLPVLQRIIDDPDSRALYLFPTKALAADQNAELNEVITLMGGDVKAYTYDGDTAASARKAVREAGHIVVTNPDMLHSGILPNHTKWVKLFENLKYIVIDEIHSYRGVFGSNLACVIMRLKRICNFYGSDPQFICCSATINNPRELAETLTGERFTLVDKSGAPTGEKHIIFYNPPVINEQLGIRRSSLSETRHIAEQLVRNGVQTIVFAKSRLNVEVLITYLKRLKTDILGSSPTVRGYRGGYLPTQRREIERGLRDGSIQAVVSTNALELGIDIGSLEACVICGYPGTIASTWQQAGRAGRRQGTSATFVVAGSTPLDQYIIKHPNYFFEQSPENALINPRNIYVAMNHMKCAAYELPFTQEEDFGDFATQDMLTYLEEENIVKQLGGKWHWMAEEFPASEISLRSADDENFLIVDITNPAHHLVIGEMDRFTVPMLLHEHAIYMHEGSQYQVEKLDFPNKKAFIRAVDVDYYTDANLNVSLRVLDTFEDYPLGNMNVIKGEVMVTSIVTMFKKMKLDTHENLGFGQVNLPELEMHTSAAMITIPETAFDGMSKEDAQSGMLGIATCIKGIAPLNLMCSAYDIACHYHVRDPFTGKPTIYLYDTVAGGIGLSDKAYEMANTLLEEALDVMTTCKCGTGCPSCVGPLGGKEHSVRILRRLLRDIQ
ncbi:MAG: DEAD/DEAH box helicase [Clostridiales bacterium]|nr:DEAD/DEAH box helicase [Clostridiales bacterium]